MATNRLLLIDLVANLREVSTLINAEHSAAVGKVVPKEFSIRFARADHVADQVMILLGLDPSSRRTPQELQVEQQRLQLFAQLQQQGKDVSKYLGGGEGPTVFLAVNHRNNSIVVNAPPKEMGVIERSIVLLDVPNGMLAGNVVEQLTMERYQLVTMKPQAIITALEELGSLDPRTQFKMDGTAKIVFAHATPADHVKIKAMISALDGTGRQFEVIWLRRLPADAVAASIHSLMVGEEEKDDNSRNRGFYYFGYREQEEESESPTKGFRVDADVENNRLLLWANENELKEVRKLLAKLGELTGDSTNPHTVRVLDARSENATRKMLDQIRQRWPSLAPNALEIDDDALQRGADELDRSQPPAQDPPPPLVPTLDSVQRPGPATGMPTQDESAHMTSQAPSTALVSAVGSPDWSSEWVNTAVGVAMPVIETPNRLENAIAEAAPNPDAVPAVNPIGDAAEHDAAGADTDVDTDTNANVASDVAANVAARELAVPTKINLRVDEDGRIVLSSSDTKALDQLEDLITTVSGKPKSYQVYYLRYALASLVKLNLEDYFDQDGDTKSNDEDNYWRGWYGFDMGSDKKDTSKGLGKRRKILFIDDYDTNSILVSNASAEQLETVESLVKIYDRPLSEDSISARRFEIFRMKHARAGDVAKTIKEVYRDLLSSKDQVFEKSKDEKDQSSQGTNYYRVYGGMGGGTGGEEQKPKKIKASFAGALSVGVDEVSNTVIISAQEEWMSTIAEMVRYLDSEAKPYRPTVEVINTRVSPETLQAALTRVFGSDSPQVKQPTQEGEQGKKADDNQAQPPQPPQPPPPDPDF